MFDEIEGREEVGSEDLKRSSLKVSPDDDGLFCPLQTDLLSCKV